MIIINYGILPFGYISVIDLMFEWIEYKKQNYLPLVVGVGWLTKRTGRDIQSS